MSRKPTSVSSIVAGLLFAIPAAAQQKDLTYNTVAPCVFVNTLAAGGAFAANETRTYNVVGSGSFAGQGGSATGCGVPGFSNGIARVQAVEIAIVAISPTGPGHVITHAADTTSAVGFLSFTSGMTIANTASVAVAQTSGVGDIKINVGVSGAHISPLWLATTPASARRSSSGRGRRPPRAARRCATLSPASPTTRLPSPI